MHISDVELNAPQGVYLYLGYSSKDETRLKEVTQLGALEAIGAIQGLVSFHNVNGNKVRTTQYWTLIVYSAADPRGKKIPISDKFCTWFHLYIYACSFID